MRTPEEFNRRMENMLGEEYESFLASYEEGRRPGLRLNTLKSGAQKLPGWRLFGLSPVPWAPNGFFYDPETRPGKHPFHECGVYYIQEPSAMAVAALSGVKPGMRVLDLCAAPGGKSTQLASMLDGQGLLISNEIHPARAKILSQNIERMGITNCIVTNEPPESLQRRFPLFFDTVVVDAPCSGEGMFRKEPEAIPNWSPQNVELCADRQLGILECAAEMTAPGGTLVYSTCTFAPAEDERNAAVFMARHPEFEIADLPSELGKEYMERTGLCAAVPDWALLPENPETEGGMSPETLKEKAEAVSGCIRLWPHKLEGEGHFLAVFRKSGEPFERRIPAAGPLKDKEANARWKEFCEEALSEQGKKKSANYWFGLSTGVVDIRIPANVYQTKKMLSFMKNSVIKGEMGPFSGEIHTRDGKTMQVQQLQNKRGVSVALEEMKGKDLLHMDWLNENIDGELPKIK